MNPVTLSKADPPIPVTIRLPRELHQRLAQEAARRSTNIRKVSMVEVIRQAIDSVC